MIGELYPGEFEAMEHNGRMDALEQVCKMREATQEEREGINRYIDSIAEPCEDAMSRILKRMWNCRGKHTTSIDKVKMEQILRDELSPINPQPKTGHCKNCKWWKDSDGLYRRGSHAESQCPINRREVFEGNGYCYMFEPQESEEV